MQTPAWCREQATQIGPACGQFIDGLLGDRPLDRLRGAQGVLRLAQRYGAVRLEAACARAGAVAEYRYHTITAILVQGLDQHPRSDLPPVPTTGVRPRHARPWPYFFPHH